MPQDVDQAAPEEPATELGRFLREHREEILERWAQATREEASIRDLDERHLIDHLPAILDEVAEALEIGGGGKGVRGEAPAAHALERLEMGFTLEELVAEYRLLRRSILRVCCSRAAHLVTRTVEDVNEAVDRALERSMVRFRRQRERTLRTLERLADVAVSGATLDELLKNLLRTLAQQVTAVDGASLFLREGDLLRLRATVGLAEERGELTLRMGEGFAGQVAARREPRLVHSAATHPLVKSELYRRLRVRALYGVPLLVAGEATGVATIASLTAPDFSSDDKLLMRALVRRASALIDQYVLREAAEDRAHQLRNAELLMSVHPDSFSIVGRDHRVRWASPALLKRWGVSLDQAKGRTLDDLGYAPPLVGVLQRQYDRVIGGETVQSVADYASPTGERGVYEYVLAPVRDAAGQVEAVAGVARDVSLRFHAEKARADALARERAAREEAEKTVGLLDSLLAGSPAGIAFIDRGLRFARMNEAMAGVVGRPPEEQVGRAVRDVLPEHGASLEPLMRRVMETGEPLVNLELQVRPPSTPDRLRAFLGNAFPVRLRGGDIIGVGVVSMEITDRKNMEEELRRAVTMRERVMSILGHDLRSPLSVVVAGAALLRRSEMLGEQELRTVARITRAGDRMARMIHDLLDYARASGDGLPIDRRPSNLRIIAQHAIDELRAAFPGAHLQLVETGFAPHGKWDADRLTQMLINLLTNAIQYSPPGSPVELRLSGGGDRVVLEVHNGGSPIPQDVLSTLYEPFHRTAASDASSPGGLGLGLFIVKRIVDGHGGTVTVRSTAGDGTTFTITLPRA